MSNGDDALWYALVDSLHVMEDECSRKSLYKGDPYPTCLRWYGPELSARFGRSLGRCGRNQHEVAWSLRLNSLLRERGLVCDAQVAYPARLRSINDGVTRGTCDLVVGDKASSRTWIEIKGAWPYWYVHGRGADGRYIASSRSVYQRYLFQDTRDDLRKLAPLNLPEANEVSLLLVGFDKPDGRLHADVRSFATTTGVNDAPWTQREIAWDEVHYGDRISAWMWTRAVGSATRT